MGFKRVVFDALGCVFNVLGGFVDVCSGGLMFGG